MSMNLGTLAITTTNTSFPAPNDGVKAILIGCESGLTCTITMEGGGVQKTLYPGTVDWFDVRKGFTGNIKIAPVAILNNVATFPASTLIFDAIGLNDSEQANMYPLALPSRNTNIGNQVNTVGGVANSIQNDNSTAGTLIAESTVAGDSASAVALLNTGHLTLGTVNNPGVLTVIPDLGTSEQVQIDGTGTLTVNRSIAANLIKTVTGNDLTLDVETGHKVALQVNNTDVVDVNANGLTLLSGAIDINSAPITVNGSTSGTAKIYQFFQGSYKKVIVIMSNFRNGGGSNQDQALTTPFTATTMITTTATINAISLVASGVAQTVGVLTTLNASGGGTTTNETAIQSSSFAYFNGAWDTIRFVSGQASAHSGMVIFEGV